MKLDRECPFCKFKTGYFIDSKLPETSPGIQVICDECGARGPIYSTEKEALEGWNEEFLNKDEARQL